MKTRILDYLTILLICVFTVACSDTANVEDDIAGGADDGAVAEPPIGNLSGTWEIVESVRSTTAGCTAVNIFDFTVVQSGNDVIVTYDTGSAFQGEISNATLGWTGSYPAGPEGSGGVITIDSLVVVVADDCQTLTGQSEWSYSETGFSCSGTTETTARRISGGNGTSCEL